VATPLACEIGGSVSIFSLLDLNRATKQYRTCCANADVREFQPQPTGACCGRRRFQAGAISRIIFADKSSDDLSSQQ